MGGLGLEPRLENSSIPKCQNKWTSIKGHWEQGRFRIRHSSPCLIRFTRLILPRQPDPLSMAIGDFTFGNSSSKSFPCSGDDLAPTGFFLVLYYMGTRAATEPESTLPQGWGISQQPPPPASQQPLPCPPPNQRWGEAIPFSAESSLPDPMFGP